MTEQRHILLLCEDPPCCPDCGRHMSMSSAPIDRDNDGDRYEVTCETHGTWRAQTDEEAIMA